MTLHFRPLKGLSSGHLQTILAAMRRPGKAPPSKRWLVELKDGDQLSCEVSIPSQWSKTIVMIHGMGGSHASNYMVRIARKFYLRGYKVVRVNLRGSGSGNGLSKLPYNAGTSEDIHTLLQVLKKNDPSSELFLIGYSLGGNIVLKLAGELGEKADSFVHAFIAICPPVDLARSVLQLQANIFYHNFYLKKIRQQARRWTGDAIRSLSDFDEKVTARLWGYQGAQDYYQRCSSLQFLPCIKQTTYILFAEDDPLISIDSLKGLSLDSKVHLWVTKQGGHMGFLGKTAKEHRSYWLDETLMILVNYLER